MDWLVKRANNVDVEREHLNKILQEIRSSITSLENLTGTGGGNNGSNIDHGALLGLSDDDHTQYHNDTRGDLRYQPLDSDLTAIAALTTTSYGRDLLELADADALGALVRLDQIAAPSASVDFADQQATSFRIENRTSDPGSPTTGQIWLRTDL